MSIFSFFKALFQLVKASAVCSLCGSALTINKPVMRRHTGCCLVSLLLLHLKFGESFIEINYNNKIELKLFKFLFKLTIKWN